MKIRARFVDANGVNVTEQVLPPNAEGEKDLEEVWVKSFYELLMDSLRRGDNVSIEIIRTVAETSMYVV